MLTKSFGWESGSRVNKRSGLERDPRILDFKRMNCGIDEAPFAFTLITASKRKERLVVSRSISNNPPHCEAMSSKVLVHQRSNGSPLTEIHPLKCEKLV